MHPHSPRGDTALPQPQGEHRAPLALVPGKLHGEQELPPPLSHPHGHREGPGPSPSPTRLIAMARAAERPGGTRGFAGLGEETRTCVKPRIHHQGGLMSLGRGKEGAAVSGQPGQWCQQRRGWHQQGGELCPCPRANTVHSRASHPLLSLKLRLNKLVTAPAAETTKSYWENWRNKQNPLPVPLASCVGWPAPGR